jgi:hypothetical protein
MGNATLVWSQEAVVIYFGTDLFLQAQIEQKNDNCQRNRKGNIP